MPVLNSIRMSGITDVLVVITRYFGGILLGAGGLVRAYSTAASMALNEGGTRIFQKYDVFKVNISYSDYGKINTELINVDAIIDNTEFSNDVSIVYALKTEDTDSFNKKLLDVFAGKVIPEFIESRIDSK